MAPHRIYATLGSLFSKDLTSSEEHNQVYFLFFSPSSYSTQEYRFLNRHKYRVFDCPPPLLDFNRFQYPTRNLAAVGNEFAALVEREPGQLFVKHWRRWLSVFPPPVLKSIDEGLTDNVPVVVLGPMECIADEKHFYGPLMHARLNRKSTIPEMGVPCPRYMTKENASFPCLAKVDLAWAGLGNFVAKNQQELDAVIEQIEQKLGWDGGYVIQEFLSGVTEVPGYTMYLTKTGEIHWIGIEKGGFTGFTWSSCQVDWDEQEKLQAAVYEEFTIPITSYLLKQGYFGLVNFEVVTTKTARYVVDINLRVNGSTTHLLIAPYMADLGYPKSSYAAVKRFSCERKELVARADRINERNTGRVIVFSAIDLHQGCQADVSMYGKSQDDVSSMFQELAV